MNKLTKDEYLNQFKQTTDLMYETTYKKNHDYSGGELAFANFDTIEGLSQGRIMAEEGILVRMTDKITRITNLLYTKGLVQDEKITDTLIDLANYSIILALYIKNKNTDDESFN